MECYEFNWFVGDEVDACAFNMNREVISVSASMVFYDELAGSIEVFDKCCRPILGFVVIELRIVTKHFSKIKYSDHASICAEMANGFFGDGVKCGTRPITVDGVSHHGAWQTVDFGVLVVTNSIPIVVFDDVTRIGDNDVTVIVFRFGIEIIVVVISRGEC